MSKNQTLRGAKTMVTNWGQYPKVDTNLISLIEATNENGFSTIARGLGRCYGDASLNRDSVLDMRPYNQAVILDESRSEVLCDAGVSYYQLLNQIVPKGFFVGVTPGTQFVTMGGAINSDVHGKNHHGEGTIKNFVKSVEVRLANGEEMTCSREAHKDLFDGLFGSQGLLAITLKATLKLKKIKTSWIDQKTMIAHSLDEMLDLFTQQDAATYSVAWLDCLTKGAGRGVLITGEHREDPFREKTLFKSSSSWLQVPFNFPGWVLNKYSMEMFNHFYFLGHRLNKRDSVVPLTKFFYPLDSISHWNRIYGSSGFVQYQFVIPESAARACLQDCFKLFRKKLGGSFLAVLKKFGSANTESPLSFPRPGFTLALDFKMSDDLLATLHELDHIVLHYSGSVYLAKDARLPSEAFRKMYRDQIPAFLALKNLYDPTRKFRSLLSERIFALV